MRHHEIMSQNYHHGDLRGHHLLLLAHSLGAGGVAFSSMAALAREFFSLNYSILWDLGWATVGFGLCWTILLCARYSIKTCP
jgi:hypothetical protein